MTVATMNTLRALLAGDPTVTKGQARGILRTAEGKGNAPQSTQIGRILTAGEVAALAHKSTRTVRAWAKRGYLEAIRLPGRKDATGYTEASVRALVEGRAGK